MTHTAIVLAAGQGKRMQSDVAKQFMELNGRPLICYALDTFEKSSRIDRVILVTNEGALSFCENEIVKRYGYTKVEKVICGGAERYDSVYNGLKEALGSDYIYIHDGARPFVTEGIIEDLAQMVAECGACVAAMPVKDTIKIVNADGFSTDTPNRNTLWQIQTPQVFAYKEILEAYEKMYQEDHNDVTDDAMVMERYGKLPVKMCRADYRNIKITTPEDLTIAGAFLDEKKPEKN